ncbi:hypothetical protein [Streptomyces bluensis]|uniref:hypothetical protein n=1 Tax=Streptomyces bluensis TaxID=33897 RepID=UPI00167A483B|nr:hypothetical protein [Streptomyces bluensis]GGZ67324.1 hypothetical protein GCM10010344_37920 [Streptomyces bluensis]
MAGDNVDNVEGRTAREQQERATGEQRERDRLLESDRVAHNGEGIDRSAFKTDFMSYSINGLRGMILDSDPGTISTVGSHWKKVHEILSGGDGDGKTGGVDTESANGSIAGLLKTAVENVREHWEGEAAEAFQRRADEIGVQIRNGAAHANFTAEQLFAISKDLDAAITKMEKIEEPSRAERASDRLNDDGRDDSQMRRDLAAGASADTVAQANEKNLSLQMERRLEAVAVMEELAANYQVYSKNLKSGGRINEREGITPPNNETTMPPPIAVPTPSGRGPGPGGVGNKPWSAGPTGSVKPAPVVPRDAGITGGSQLPTARTKVDSISPGLTGTGPSAGPAGVGGGAGGGGTGGAQGPGVVAPGGTSGLGRGAAARGGIGVAGGRGGLAGGGAAAGRGAGGRAGMGGMGGAGAGAAGRGGAGAGGRGALARSRGGVVGAAKGVTGKGAGGGAGLHGSRGGTQRGAMAGGAGGVGGRKGRRSEDENTQGDRPDYLVEDEETWISEEDRNRNVPRTIE